MAVRFALTRLIGGRISPDDALRLQGSGWYGDLAAMRTDRNDRTDRRGGVDA